MNLLEVKVFAKVGFPDLSKERLAQVEELGFFEIGSGVGVVWMEIVCGYPV